MSSDSVPLANATRDDVEQVHQQQVQKPNAQQLAHGLATPDEHLATSTTTDTVLPEPEIPTAEMLDQNSDRLPVSASTETGNVDDDVTMATVSTVDTSRAVSGDAIASRTGSSHRRTSVDSFPTQSKTIEKTIRPRASFRLLIDVSPKQFIWWEFKTANRDIGFGVFSM